MTAGLAATEHANWPPLLDAASAPYRRAGRFAWQFARGKLGMDPVFRHLLREGLIRPQARVLDIGCGRGLLASLLQGPRRRRSAANGRSTGPRHRSAAASSASN